MTDSPQRGELDAGHRSGVLRAALAASGTGTWRWDRASGAVEWDAMMEQLSGLEPGSFGSTFDAWVGTIHPDDREGVVVAVNDAVDRLAPVRVEYRVARSAGPERWLESRGQVTTDADGRATGTIGSAVDITERKVAEVERERHLARSAQLMDRLDRLQRIGGLLAGAVSVEEVGTVVLDHLGTPNTAASRGMWLLDDQSSTLDMVAGLGFETEVLDQFRSIPLSAELPAAVAVRERQVIRSDEPSEAVSAFPLLADVRRTTSGFVVLPLLVEDTCHGVISVGYDQTHLPDLDMRFLEAASGHIAQAVARIRLSDTVARWAHEAAEAADRERRRREQVEFIAQVTASATAAADHRDLMERVVNEAVPRLGDWCVLHFAPSGTTEPEVAMAHVDPAKVEYAWRLSEEFPYDPAASTGPAGVMRSGRPQIIERIDSSLIETVARERGTDPATIRTVLDTLELNSSITIPLMTKAGPVGAMQFISAESHRPFGVDDLALAEAVAGRIADALYAAWVTEQQRQVAESLQQALLPPDLPTITGLDIAARYWPAGAVNDVGGDFYDLFRIGEDRWAVVIGDVCGTGPDAAAVTAIARHTIRAAARHGVEAVEVLDWVNEAVMHSDRDLFCTLCYATLERHDDGWRFRSTSAGHPLPVALRSTGEAVSLGEPGTLLGVFGSITNHTHEVTLGHGDAVVLYTDGVTDLPPPHDLTPGAVEDLLARSAVGDAGGIADAIHDSLLERIPDASRHDDVAVLVLRVD